jgi:hypothetical protein
VEALEGCVAWEDSSLARWQSIRKEAGEWLLVSTGPDLIAETPEWWGFPCVPRIWHIREEGYREKNYFTAYDPTNGTVSYGNIFRSQKNPSGMALTDEFLAAASDQEGPPPM